MSISFDNIPASRCVPGVYTEIDSSRAITGPQTLPYRVLVIGQKLPTGLAPSLVPVRVTSVDAARALFGVGSMLATMIEAGLAPDTANELWAMPVADATTGGVAAKGSITLTSNATGSGTLAAYIGGQAVNVAVNAGDAKAAVATALAAAISAKPALEVSAAVDGTDTAKVVITAKHKGLAGNGIDIRLGYFGEAPVPGLAADVEAMSAGAGNPDLADAIAALGDEWFQVWAMPYTDAPNLARVEAELASRFEPNREIEGHAFAAAGGTMGTLAALGNSRNSPHLTIVAAAGEPMTPYAKAAETAALAAFYASIDPARPLQTLPYRYCLPPAETDRFTAQERDLLLHDGIATTTVDTGGVMRTERLITTYKTNAAGGVDTAYLDVETLFTLMTIRHDWKDYLLRKYPRHKLANDGVRFGPGQVVVTPGLIKAEAVVKFREWESNGWVENFDQFKADLVVQRNATDPNRLDVLLPPDLINGLRVIANKIQFRL